MKIWKFIKFVIISIIALILMLYMFIGAVLQESYKLTPLREEEILEVNHGNEQTYPI